MIQETEKVWVLHEPKEYLNFYHDEITEEDRTVYKFWCKAAEILPGGYSMKEIGVGPCLYTVIPFVEKYKTILLTDYLQSNLDEIELSLSEDPRGFNWKPYIKLAFQLQGKPDTQEAIDNYFKLIQSKVQLKIYDMFVPSGQTSDQFDLVTAHFCIEAISSSFYEWKKLLKNCLSWVVPGGYFLMSACTQLRINRIYNPQKLMPTISDLTCTHIEDTLRALGSKVIQIQTISTPEEPYYSGNVLVLATV